VTRDELKTRVKGAWQRLRGGELTPLRAALSVAVGLAIGVTPVYGAHLFLVLAVCVPLGLDAPVSYLAANVSIPPIAPFLALAEVEIGAWLLTRHALALDAATLKTLGVWAFARELVVGTLVFAPAMALGGGLVAYAAVSLVREPRSKTAFEEAVHRVAQRYARGRRSAFYYARGKMLGDPVVKRVFELATREPLGEVTDVGSGRGQLGILLLEARGATKVLGFDWDTAKVRDAERAAAGLDASFEVGDARTHDVAACDTALLVDVLHYLTGEEQDALLTRAARAARKTVLIRDLDPDRGLRSFLTRVQEAVTTFVRWNRGARVFVRPIACIVRALEAEGFEVRVEPCWEGTPFANVLVIATRRMPSAHSSPTTTRSSTSSTDAEV
jgi:uncharacterized protein (DUF2062 family)/SAM-dependent methyltransferase